MNQHCTAVWKDCHHSSTNNCFASIWSYTHICMLIARLSPSHTHAYSLQQLHVLQLTGYLRSMQNQSTENLWGLCLTLSSPVRGTDLWQRSKYIVWLRLGSSNIWKKLWFQPAPCTRIYNRGVFFPESLGNHRNSSFLWFQTDLLCSLMDPYCKSCRCRKCKACFKKKAKISKC